tara:strand:+ start:71 stop:322 length:252 start_codon:yes stop_codon:yes gene_type:complete
MKIYKVELDLSLVMARLVSFNLQEFNSARPTIFVEANDPDEACFLAQHRFASVLLKKDSSRKIAEFIVEVLADISVKKVYVAK